MKPAIFIITALLLIGCSKSIFKSKWVNEKSSENFIARFETSKGSFDIQVSREWSPKAVDGVKGFPAFGDVIRGMEVVEALYSGYGENTMKQLDTLYLNRSRFLAIFPKLDSINKVYLLKTH